MVNGFYAGAHPVCAWVNNGTTRGISTPAFKVELRQHLMWNHTKVRTDGTGRGTPLVINLSTAS